MLGADLAGVVETVGKDVTRFSPGDEVIDYLQEDFVDCGRTFDLILDIGWNSPLTRLRRVLKGTGTLIIVGGEGGGRWLGGLDRQMRASAQSLFVSNSGEAATFSTDVPFATESCE